MNVNLDDYYILLYPYPYLGYSGGDVHLIRLGIKLLLVTPLTN